MDYWVFFAHVQFNDLMLKALRYDERFPDGQRLQQALMYYRPTIDDLQVQHQLATEERHPRHSHAEPEILVLLS